MEWRHLTAAHGLGDPRRDGGGDLGVLKDEAGIHPLLGVAIGAVGVKDGGDIRMKSRRLWNGSFGICTADEQPHEQGQCSGHDALLLLFWNSL
jgi:hypothetical protein